MSLKQYLIILGICTGLCWLGWLLVILLINPYQAGWMAFMFFYLSLAFALLGSFAIIGFMFRLRVLKKDEIAHKGINIASRQSVLFTVLILLALFLQSQRFLTWWNLVILALVVALVEMFFVSYKRFNK